MRVTDVNSSGRTHIHFFHKPEFRSLSIDARDLVRVALRALATGLDTINRSLCCVRAVRAKQADSITTAIGAAVTFVTVGAPLPSQSFLTSS